MDPVTVIDVQQRHSGELAFANERCKLLVVRLPVEIDSELFEVRSLLQLF